MRIVTNRVLLGMCLLFGLMLALPVSAKEKKITQKDVPPAVLSAFEKAHPNATIRGLATETEEGKTFFEIESVDGRTSRDILYLADGTVVEVEETLSPTDLPAAVQAAVSEKYPDAKIVKAEKTTRGSAVTYEMKITSGTNKVGLVIDESGKIIKQTKTHAKKGERHEQH